MQQVGLYYNVLNIYRITIVPIMALKLHLSVCLSQFNNNNVTAITVVVVQPCINGQLDIPV